MLLRHLATKTVKVDIFLRLRIVMECFILLDQSICNVLTCLHEADAFRLELFILAQFDLEMVLYHSLRGGGHPGRWDLLSTVTLSVYIRCYGRRLHEDSLSCIEDIVTMNVPPGLIEPEESKDQNYSVGTGLHSAHAGLALLADWLLRPHPSSSLGST